jgi:PKD repeat protein
VKGHFRFDIHHGSRPIIPIGGRRDAVAVKVFSESFRRGTIAIALVCIATVANPRRDIAVAQGMAIPIASPTSNGRITIPEPLLVSLQATPGYGPAPLLVGFLLNAVDPSGAEIASYNWNFGDGHTSTEPPILAYNTYSNPGTYVVTVRVTTTDGRSATGFTGVIVKPTAGSTSQQREQNQ